MARTQAPIPARSAPVGRTETVTPQLSPEGLGKRGPHGTAVERPRCLVEEAHIVVDAAAPADAERLGECFHRVLVALAWVDR